MENYMNDIINDFDELINLIKDSDIYKDYKSLECRVSQNKDIDELVNKIKKIQKEAVKAEAEGNKSLLKELNRQVEDLYIELNNIPLYNEYEDKMNELNNMLLIIKNKFMNRKSFNVLKRNP